MESSGAGAFADIGFIESSLVQLQQPYNSLLLTHVARQTTSETDTNKGVKNTEISS